MNRSVSKALADCISRIERGAGLDDCLEAHPSHAAELRPYLEAWRGMAGTTLVQPPSGAFESGHRAMVAALEAAPDRLSPLSRVRLAPAWASVAAAVAAIIMLLGGAAGASAALGGPDPAGDVLSAVGVNSNDGAHGGIGGSSASDRGLECANPNAFEGSANSEDKAKNAADAHQRQSCKNAKDTATPNATDACEDANRGNGNDANHNDPDNPGQGQGNNGATGEAAGSDCPVAQDTSDANNGHGNDADHTDEGNPGQGQGNHGTESNAGGNENANPNGNPNPGEPQGNGPKN